MKIVADQNIPFVAEAFAGIGEVVAVPAASINAKLVRDAEILLTRSTVRVGPALLEGSRVRFVATATIGIDHLDLDWLKSHNIACASAPGSNADSVALWFASALLELAARKEIDLSSLRIGIVGVGNVGSRVERIGRALAKSSSYYPLRCDPPRERVEGGDFVTLERILAECDLVTMHVPLYRDGADRTFHLIDEVALAKMRPSALLFNASRGEVIDCAALVGRLTSGKLRAVLDVFEREPAPDPTLIAACALATPHIAGHSLDGKLNGTKMIYTATCKFLGVKPTWKPNLERLESMTGDLLEVLGKVYRISEDDAALRRIVAQPDSGKLFREYREHYPVHRELAGVEIETSDPTAAAVLKALGADVTKNL